MLNDPRGHRVGFKESRLPHKRPTSMPAGLSLAQAVAWQRASWLATGEAPNPHTKAGWRGFGTFVASDATHPDGNRSTRRAALRQRVLDLRAKGKLTQERNPAPMGG